MCMGILPGISLISPMPEPPTARCPPQFRCVGFCHLALDGKQDACRMCICKCGDVASPSLGPPAGVFDCSCGDEMLHQGEEGTCGAEVEEGRGVKMGSVIEGAMR
mmetsp:Transcript_72576/g.151571  ORF Transcript_72576/g.151571 Transcript_72576/m.151571 type:complete len:105 (+) Transcript_72576:188-502(+)